MDNKATKLHFGKVIISGRDFISKQPQPSTTDFLNKLPVSVHIKN